MEKLAEMRNQEMLCRERALSDTENRASWTAKAEEYERLALNEIAFHFRECNADRPVYSTDTRETADVYGSRLKTIAAA